MTGAQRHPSSPAALGNNLDSVRRHNLAALLRIVHRRGPQSRSALTRVTGLNRSTIAALVAELAELKLVSEREPDSSRGVGRPSPLVVANNQVLAAAVNPEVDAVHVALVGLDGTVHRQVRHATTEPPGPEEAAHIAAVLLDGLRTAVPGGIGPIAIGAAIPGLVRESDGVVRLAPHLDWVDEPFQSYLADATGLPVQVANDASLGAHAELLFGAGRGISDLVYLYGGAAGIGGGIVSQGRLLTGSAGYAGEIGHLLVDSAGNRCRCGSVGCLETEVSQPELLEVLGRRDGDVDDLAAALAESGDPRVAEVVDRQQRYLARALRGMINAFNPQRVVLGGFLASLDAAVPGRLITLVRRHTLVAPVENVEIVPAQLGASLLMIGGAELAFDRLLADPASFAA